MLRTKKQNYKVLKVDSICSVRYTLGVLHRNKISHTI